MRFLFAVRGLGQVSTFDRTIKRLTDSGHEAVFLYGDHGPYFTRQALQACQAGTGCEVGEMVPRRKRRWLAGQSQALLDYTFMVNPSHPVPWRAESKLRFLSRPLRWLIQQPRAAAWFLQPRTQRRLWRLSDSIPPDPGVVRHLEALRPNLVVATPVLYPQSKEFEYLKAAQALGIPTVLFVLSWDNLTMKGVFRLQPNLIMVWNRRLLECALDLHRLPEEKLFITGAPRFDPWFEMAPTLGREEFCRQAGLEPERPYVIYLGSSVLGGQQAELGFVRELTQALRALEATRRVQVLVRPHYTPSSLKLWREVELPGTVVWPRQTPFPDHPATRQDFFHSLHYAQAAVGIHTSAFLDAAISDKPCLTVLTEHFQQTQTAVPHFHWLIEADFLEQAQGHEEAARRVAAIMKGEEAKAEQRRRFVADFIRPWGLTVQPSLVMAGAFEALAEKPFLRAAEINVLVQEYRAKGPAAGPPLPV